MSRELLMQSILAHMALLSEKYPKKAASPIVKRARQAVKLSLRSTSARPASPLRKAA